MYRETANKSMECDCCRLQVSSSIQLTFKIQHRPRDIILRKNMSYTNYDVFKS